MVTIEIGYLSIFQTEPSKRTQPIDEKAGDERAAKAYEALGASAPRYRGDKSREPIPLLDQPDLWDLLTIPFSREVAAAAVIDTSEKEKTPSSTSKPAKAGGGTANAKPATEDVNPMAAMTPTMLSAIARDLGKSVDSLQPEDLR